jgi:hypothetical protein
MTEDGNSETAPTTIHEIVRDPQFGSGYADRLAGQPPRPFYRDERKPGDDWAYERGRQVATWILVTGRKAPRRSDIDGLAEAYFAAKRAGVVR